MANERLPADEGADAYRARKHYRENPYPEDSWQHGEWEFGWDVCEKADTSPDAFDWITDQFKNGSLR